jgi:hypothetical protein
MIFITLLIKVIFLPVMRVSAWSLNKIMITYPRFCFNLVGKTHNLFTTESSRMKAAVSGCLTVLPIKALRQTEEGTL